MSRADFLEIEMASTAPQLNSEPVELMEGTPTTKSQKKINILDTKLAIRPFKTSPDGLEAFVQACHRKKTGESTPEIVFKCKHNFHLHS